jgi:hypothetical protein
MVVVKYAISFCLQVTGVCRGLSGPHRLNCRAAGRNQASSLPRTLVELTHFRGRVWVQFRQQHNEAPYAAETAQENSPGATRQTPPCDPIGEVR